MSEQEITFREAVRQAMQELDIGPDRPNPLDA